MKIEDLERDLREITQRANQHMVEGNIAVWKHSPDAGQHYKAAEILLVEAQRIKQEIAALKGVE